MTTVSTERLEEMLAYLKVGRARHSKETHASVKIDELRSIITELLSLRQEQPAGVVKGLDLEPQQEEAVAWQRRIKYPSIPGETPQWEQCSWREATGHFERSPVHEYRPLYAHPTPAQKVQESQPLTSPPDAGGEPWGYHNGMGQVLRADALALQDETFQSRFTEPLYAAAPSPFPKGEEPVAYADPAAVKSLHGTPAQQVFLSKTLSPAYSMALYAHLVPLPVTNEMVERAVAEFRRWMPGYSGAHMGPESFWVCQIDGAGVIQFLHRHDAAEAMIDDLDTRRLRAALTAALSASHREGE